MERKSIVIFSEDFPPKDGGIAQWASGMAESLYHMGFDVTVLTRYIDSDTERIQQKEAFRIIQVHGRKWSRYRSFYAYRALKKHCRSGKHPDVVIATTWNIARGITGIIKRNHSQLVVIVHGLEVTRTMSWLKVQWLTKTLRAADNVVAVSHFTSSRVLNRCTINPDKVLTLPNAVDPEKFFPSSATEPLRRRFHLEGKKIILTLARLQERKGHDKVLEALPAVIRQIPNVHYLIAGKNTGKDYERLSRMVKQLELDRYVTFSGYVATEEVNAFYNLCDVYIMPSRELENSGDTEGFGITFLEANACRKPVIGGRSGGVVDAIDNGITGYLVDPLDVTKIAEKLIYLLKNPGQANAMGNEGRKRVLESYTWDAIALKLTDIVFKQ